MVERADWAKLSELRTLSEEELQFFFDEAVEGLFLDKTAKAAVVLNLISTEWSNRILIKQAKIVVWLTVFIAILTVANVVAIFFAT